MLRNDFYHIARLEAGEKSLQAQIVFNPQHEIFKGHFPGNPVVPGVCMMQIIRELMEEVKQKRFRIVTGDNIKFLAVINPEETSEVSAEVHFGLEENSYAISASLFSGKITYYKFKGSFEEA